MHNYLSPSAGKKKQGNSPPALLYHANPAEKTVPQSWKQKTATREGSILYYNLELKTHNILLQPEL